jgi:DNA-binding NarL/FixJ family response regulator
MIRLLVCDDSDGARAALHAMLHEQGEIEIVGEASNGAEAVELAASLAPDVVLMDVAMPVLGGVEATRRIRKMLPGSRARPSATSSTRCSRQAPTRTASRARPCGSSSARLQARATHCSASRTRSPVRPRAASARSLRGSCTT